MTASLARAVNVHFVFGAGEVRTSTRGGGVNDIYLGMRCQLRVGRKEGGGHGLKIAVIRRGAVSIDIAVKVAGRNF